MKRNRKDLAPQVGVKVESSLINNHQLHNLKDLTAVVPNFYMPDYGNRQRSTLYIRGIGVKAKAPAAGFYVDGMPHFEGAAFDFILDDVRSVEVLPGAQGALYGRNAIGGIVDVRTFSPFDRTGTRLRLGYGNYNDFSANVSTQPRSTIVGVFLCRQVDTSAMDISKTNSPTKMPMRSKNTLRV